MGQEFCFETPPSFSSLSPKPNRHDQKRAGARRAFRTIAALVALLLVAVPWARAQGYMYGRASFSVGSSGEGPASVAVGDFNQDGVLDLAVVQASRNSVAILLGKVDGTFAPAVFYDTGVQPVAVVVGDFDGDGRLDLAIANQNCGSQFSCGANGSVSILLGNGDGTFQPHTDVASGTQPGSMAVGDFNADGKLDLAISNGAQNSVLVLLGNGDGTFQGPVAYGTPAMALGVAAGDFNGDGKIDLAVAGSQGAVSIFLGAGDGTFQPAGEVLVLPGPHAVMVGDFNGDGMADLAVIYSQENAVSILLGNGDGTFQPRLDYPTGIYPAALALGDFNGDGRLDLAVANTADRTFSILLGSGDGTFQAALDFMLPGPPTALAAGDFNGDGKADLSVVVSEVGAVSIITGRGDGTFSSPQAYGGSPGAWAVAAGDFSGDGKLDLVTTNLGDNTLSMFLGGGDGTFQFDAAFPTGPVPVEAAVADFNGDGKLDLAVVNQTCTSLPCQPGSVSIFLGNGDGTFQPRTDYPAGNIPVAVTVADFNGDGFPDLAVVNNGFGSSNSLSIFLGRGDGTFQSKSMPLTGPGPVQAVTADFDGNGTIDLAVAFSGGISILPGRGDGTFGPRVDYPIANGVMAIAVGDFNHDGKPDLAVTTTDSVVVLLGSGGGVFQPGISYSLGTSTNLQSLLAGDFSGDGTLDLLVGKTGNAVSILVGRGDGTFLPPVEAPAGKAVHGWVAGDFDGDGGLDLAAASVDANAVFVALNTPVAALYPGGLEFGPQTVDMASAPAAVTLSNPSGAPLEIASVTASSGFTVSNGCPSTLAPATNCTLSVALAPLADGDSRGVLAITDNAPGSPQLVRLHGTGTGGPTAAVSPGSLNFGAKAVGTASTVMTVTLANLGNAPLAISGIAAAGDFAATHNCPASLGAGLSCTISVTFTPTTTGSLVGSLNVTDDAPGSPQAVALIGRGTAPRASLSASSLSFGSQAVGKASSAQSLTLSNTGDATLAVDGVTATGFGSRDFAVQNACGGSLAPGASCGLSVTFTPAAAGPRAATLTITTNAVGNPPAAALTGAGADFSLSVPAGSATALTVTPGQRALFHLALEPAGMKETVSFGCGGAPAEATCQVSPGTAALDGVTPVEFTVSVQTAAASAGWLRRPHLPGRMGTQGELVMLLALLVTLGGVAAAARRRVAWGLATLLVAAVLWPGCGGGGQLSSDPRHPQPGTPAGTYILTITASSPNVIHSTSLTLTVQD